MDAKLLRSASTSASNLLSADDSFAAAAAAPDAPTPTVTPTSVLEALREQKEWTRAVAFEGDGRLVAATVKPLEGEVDAFLKLFDKREATIASGIVLLNEQYDVHRFHPPLIYGRRGDPAVEESEGVAVCRVEKKSSKQPLFCLITYAYPTLSARAVPQLKDFCDNYHDDPRADNTVSSQHLPPAHSPARAVKMVARWLALGEDDALALLNALSTGAAQEAAVHGGGDVVLALHVNDAWVATHGAAGAAAVVDALVAGSSGAPVVARSGFYAFRFASFEALRRCRRELATQFPSAFAKPRVAFTEFADADNALLTGVPVATTAVIDTARLWDDDPFKFNVFDTRRGE
ncbi:hypothetical protein PybrP1_005265 [[Pythium] brassicae (nom. inval.)]|nr:hypothetical protein PybrP1_005265 [[Pythium] brassicae (nom. inval.)]